MQNLKEIKFHNMMHINKLKEKLGTAFGSDLEVKNKLF